MALNAYLRYYTGFRLFAQVEGISGSSLMSLKGDPYPVQSGYAGGSVSNDYLVSGFTAGVGYSIKLNQTLCLEPLVKYLNLKYNEKNIIQKNYKRKGLMVNIVIVCYFKL